MSNFPPMHWPGVLHVMQNLNARKLTDNIGDAAAALGSAQNVAEVVADARATLTDEQIGVLVGAGALLIKFASDFADAQGEFDQVMARLKRGEKP